MKRVLIEALDAQSRIVYTAEGRYEQNGGFSYYAWPKRFRPYKLEKTKDLTLIFKLTDRTTSISLTLPTIIHLSVTFSIYTNALAVTVRVMNPS